MVELRIGDEHLELSWEEWEARVREGRVPPTALVRFAPATGDRFVPADSLELYRSLRNDGVIAWHGQFASVPPLLTALLVGIQVRLWWAATWNGRASNAVLNDLTLHAPSVFEDGQVWRVLTMGFSHKAAFHLGLNMLWLAYCGWNLERALGRANLLALYLASVFVGSLCSMAGEPGTPSLGASGGVFGLVAASIVFGFSRPQLLPDRGRQLFGWALVPYVILMFGSGLASEGTDNWSHFGGLITGAALALVLDPPTLQRRPGWNRAWLAGTGATLASVLLVIAVAGPRLVPLQAADAASARHVAASTASPDAPRWSVPAGWKRGRTASGDAGFLSPSGFRAWAVLARTHDTPPAAEDLRAEWVARVRAAWPDATIADGRVADLAGAPALATAVVLPNAVGGERHLDHRVVVRGRASLAAVWEVDAAREARLAPLEARLRATVAWPEPEALVTARTWIERAPDDPRARDAWALALAETGRPEEALAVRLALVDEFPGNLGYWSNLLDLVSWYPATVDDPVAVVQRALDHHPTGAMAAAAADVLDRLGEDAAAVGLLDLAWNDLPGERSVRRARRSRDLPNALDPAGLPWDLAMDPLTGLPRDPAWIEARRALPLTIDAGRTVGEARRREHAALVDAVVAAIDAGDVEAAIDRSAWLRDGQPAANPDDRVSLRAELAEASGERPATWIPGVVVAAAHRRPLPAP